MAVISEAAPGCRRFFDKVTVNVEMSEQARESAQAAERNSRSHESSCGFSKIEG